MSKIAVTVEGHTYEVELNLAPQNSTDLIVKVNGQPVRVTLPDVAAPSADIEWIAVDDHSYEVVFDPDLHWINSRGDVYHLALRDVAATVAQPRSGDGRLKAPIPGLITQVMVSMGQEVEAGQPLLVLEAMKMENELRAPRAGIVSALHVSPGQTVGRNEVLAEIT
jgi:biotin carboxyl carrier protein